MNAAEKAAFMKRTEQQRKIEAIFVEAQKWHGEYNPNAFYYNEGTLRDTIRIAAAEKKSQTAKKKAIKLYEKCAKMGHVESMECLLTLYGDGKEYRKWLLVGAEHGSIKCMKELIDKYKYGYGGMVQSETTAKKWEERINIAIRERYAEALDLYRECKSQFDLYGDGSTDADKLKSEDRKLLERAINLFTELATCEKYEHVKSMEMLGEIYMNWLHDKKQAVDWYYKGAKHGSELCEQIMNKI